MGGSRQNVAPSSCSERPRPNPILRSGGGGGDKRRTEKRCASRQVGRSASRQAGRSTGRPPSPPSASWQVGESAGRQVGRATGRQVDRSASQQVGRSVGRHVSRWASPHVGRQASRQAARSAGFRGARSIDIDAFLDFQVFLFVRARSRGESPSASRRAGCSRDVRDYFFARRSAVGDPELLSVPLQGSSRVAALGARPSWQSLECCSWAQREARAEPARARHGARVSRPRLADRPDFFWWCPDFFQTDSGIFPRGVWNFSKISFQGRNGPAAWDIWRILKSGIFPT